MVQPHELITAYNHNVHHNQIGYTDGVDPEVMADLGYETFERTKELISGLGNTATTTSEVTVVYKKPVICGDCGQSLPCRHGNGRGTFGH